MKNTFNNILYIFLSIALFTGCSKDLGNYDYQDLNKIDSVTIATGRPLDSTTFSLSMGETLEIKPTLYSSM